MDIILNIPVETSFWSNTMYEPLIIGIIIPLANQRPFKIRRSKQFLEMERIDVWHVGKL